MKTHKGKFPGILLTGILVVFCTASAFGLDWGQGSGSTQQPPGQQPSGRASKWGQASQPANVQQQPGTPRSASGVEVKSSNPVVIKLEAGKAALTATVNGTYLNKVTRVDVIQDGNVAGKIEAKLGPSSPSSRQVSLRADVDASPGSYQLRLIAGTDKLDVPSSVLRIDVIGSNVRQTNLASSTAGNQKIPSQVTETQNKLNAFTDSQKAKCEVTTTSVPPLTAQIMDEVTITGNRMEYCDKANFTDSAGKVYPAKIVTSNTSLKVTVPVDIGAGPGALHIVSGSKEVKSLPFTITRLPAVLRSIAPSSVFPGEDVTITAGNLRPSSNKWMVSLDVGGRTPGTTETIEVEAKQVNANSQTHEGTIVFTVPDIYDRRVHGASSGNGGGRPPIYEDTSTHKSVIKAPKQVYLPGSNKLSVEIKSPHYILNLASPTTVNQGDAVTITGENYFDPKDAYVGYFEYLPWQTLKSTMTQFVNSSTFKITVPANIFYYTNPDKPLTAADLGNVKVFLVRANGYESNRLPLTIHNAQTTCKVSQQPDCKKLVNNIEIFTKGTCDDSLKWHCCAAYHLGVGPSDPNYVDPVCGKYYYEVPIP